MKLLKLLVLLISFFGIACTSNRLQQPQTQEADIPTVAERDPVIELEACRNKKLLQQTEEEIAANMTLPDITYPFDSIRPPEYSYEFLDKLANVLNTRPSMKLIIEGNSDIVGGKDYNYWLAASRAAAMKSYLVSRGVLADRIRIHSYGADRPITLDNSSEGRQANRRVHFVLTTRDWQSVY